MNDFNSVIMVRIYMTENNFFFFFLLIMQEGCKGLLYMVLHARVVLDLCEHFEQEISFEQVEGDFDSFQGKWLLEQLGNHHTLLKYVVESKMRKDTFLSEAIMEEVCHNILSFVLGENEPASVSRQLKKIIGFWGYGVLQVEEYGRKRREEKAEERDYQK